RRYAWPAGTAWSAAWTVHPTHQPTGRPSPRWRGGSSRPESPRPRCAPPGSGPPHSRTTPTPQRDSGRCHSYQSPMPAVDYYWFRTLRDCLVREVLTEVVHHRRGEVLTKVGQAPADPFGGDHAEGCWDDSWV